MVIFSVSVCVQMVAEVSKEVRKNVSACVCVCVSSGEVDVVVL